MIDTERAFWLDEAGWCLNYILRGIHVPIYLQHYDVCLKRAFAA